MTAQLPEGTVQPGRRMRAYFAASQRTTSAPTIFDPARDAGFDLDSPPWPWMDAGWIRNFKRSSGTKVEPMMAGLSGGVTGQFRTRVDAQVEFEFLQWGKLQMAVSSGSQQMNVPAETGGATGSADGGAAAAAVPVLDGSTASEIVLGAAVSGFSVGDLVAVDVDYNLLPGYVGSGIAGAFVEDAADVGSDVDYVRRVTFNVARVKAKTATTLRLSSPLIAGVPAGAKAQKVAALVDREGGTFFQEWSALFVWQSETGARTSYFYPRVQSAAAAAEGFVEMEDLSLATLKAKLRALPVVDARDREEVVGYRVIA